MVEVTFLWKLDIKRTIIIVRIIIVFIIIIIFGLSLFSMKILFYVQTIKCDFVVGSRRKREKKLIFHVSKLKSLGNMYLMTMQFMGNGKIEKRDLYANC